jgi:molybdopterin adenylyltransferase
VRVAVVTISDRASRGEYEDLSGPEVEREVLARLPGSAVTRRVTADEVPLILAALEACADSDFILTTGGTGIGPRDVTPEATPRFCEREIPGIAEALRAHSLAETPAAMLSRAVAGVRGRCIVVNLPGSPKAVRRCMEALGPVMEHALRMVRGEGH